MLTETIWVGRLEIRTSGGVVFTLMAVLVR